LFDVGWSSAFLCLVISVYVATAHLQQRPRLFTVMALLACAWVLVLSAYYAPGDRNPTENLLLSLATDIGIVLFAYIGGLLVSDVQATHAGHAVKVPLELKIPLALLFLVAAPRAVELPGPLGHLLQLLTGNPAFNAREVQLIVSLVIDFVGFASLARGVYVISGSSQIFKVLVVIIACYLLLLSWRTYDQWPDRTQAQAFYLLSVAAAKLALTVLFSIAVVRYATGGVAQATVALAPAAPPSSAPPVVGGPAITTSAP
jgi:hypothetical protein